MSNYFNSVFSSYFEAQANSAEIKTETQQKALDVRNAARVRVKLANSDSSLDAKYNQEIDTITESIKEKKASVTALVKQYRKNTSNTVVKNNIIRLNRQIVVLESRLNATQDKKFALETKKLNRSQIDSAVTEAKALELEHANMEVQGKTLDHRKMVQTGAEVQQTLIGIQNAMEAVDQNAQELTSQILSDSLKPIRISSADDNEFDSVLENYSKHENNRNDDDDDDDDNDDDDEDSDDDAHVRSNNNNRKQDLADIAELISSSNNNNNKRKH